MSYKDPNNKKEPSPIVVKAGAIAKAVSVSERQVGYWAEQGRIPSYKLGNRCRRYSLPEVLKALGIEATTH